MLHTLIIEVSIVTYVQLITHAAVKSKNYLKTPLKSRNIATMKVQMISVFLRKLAHSTTKSTLFTVSNNEWDTKEDTGKLMRNALHVLRYTKRHFSG